MFRYFLFVIGFESGYKSWVLLKFGGLFNKGLGTCSRGLESFWDDLSDFASMCSRFLFY